MPGLEELPNELLIRVLRELVAIENEASFPPAAPNAPEPTLSYRFGDGVRYGPFNSCYNLCFVSKKIKPAASQVLFENIFLNGNLFSAAALVCILLEAPKLADLVRNLHIALDEESPDMKDISGAFGYARVLCKEELRKRGLEALDNDGLDGERLEDSLDGQLMLCLLSLSNLKSLGLDLRAPLGSVDRNAPHAIFDLIMRQQILGTELSLANRGVLDNLKTLKLNCVDDPFATLSRDLLTVFKLENLQSLELSNFVSCNANALETALQRANITSHNLKELAMFDCRWRARDLEVLGAILPNLESLKWVLMEDHDTVPDPNSPVFPDSLNSTVVLRAFKPCRKVLKKLTICMLTSIYDWQEACKHHSLNGAGLAVHANRTQRALYRTCDFSRFPALHTLTANAAYAFTLRDLSPYAASPSHRFPAKLASLTLRHASSVDVARRVSLLGSKDSADDCGILMQKLLERTLNFASSLNNLREVLIEVPIPRPGIEWPACDNYWKNMIYNHCETYPTVHARIIGHPDWLHDSSDTARPGFYKNLRARDLVEDADDSGRQVSPGKNIESRDKNEDDEDVVEPSKQKVHDASSDRAASGIVQSTAGSGQEPGNDEGSSEAEDEMDEANDEGDADGGRFKDSNDEENDNGEVIGENGHRSSDEVKVERGEPGHENHHRVSPSVGTEGQESVPRNDHNGSDQVDNQTGMSFVEGNDDNGAGESEWEAEHDSSDKVADESGEPDQDNVHDDSNDVEDGIEKSVDDSDSDSGSDDEFYDAFTGLEDLQIK